MARRRCRATSGGASSRSTWSSRGGFASAGNSRPAEPLEHGGKPVREGVVTDGPFVETKEQLCGFYLVEVGSEDEALAVARAVPASPDSLRRSGACRRASGA